jgi:hypothetical protein
MRPSWRKCRPATGSWRQMRPNFAALQTYYVDAATGSWGRRRARAIRFVSNRRVPDNYSPTSYLINTLLPADNSNHTMDYVATIAIEWVVAQAIWRRVAAFSLEHDLYRKPGIHPAFAGTCFCGLCPD